MAADRHFTWPTAFFSAATIFGVLIILPLLPSLFTQFLLIGGGLWSLAGVVRRQTDFSLLYSVAVFDYVLNTWFNDGLIGFGTLTIAAWVAIFVLGLGLERLSSEPIMDPAKQAQQWLIAAFVGAELATVLAYWPIAASGRTFIFVVLFYAVFQLIRQNHPVSRRSEALHFLFTLVAVILIVSGVIWTNLGQLGIF